MKINQINIDGFGKLRDFHIDFRNGFNIIYGNNEDGKSTLMDFIKMMFYGSPASKRDEILRNPRKKYLPKDGGSMGGNIIFENQGKSYRLERAFSGSNSSDKINLYNLTDNVQMSVPAKTTIGQMFFGFNASAFEKTFFINQIGSPINDDDEINQRLANLNSTGDESISSQKVRSRLLSAKESFKSQSGKIGKLDRRYAKLHEFEQLLEKEKNDETEKSRMMKQSKELSGKIKNYEETYKIAVDKIDTQEKLARLERLKTIASYKQILDDLNRQLAEKKSSLTSGDFTADPKFVSGCEDILEVLKKYEQKRISMKSEYERLCTDLKNYSDGFIIENEKKEVAEIQKKIMHMSLEIRNINDEISSVRSKTTVLQEKLKNAEIDFHLAESNFRSVESINKQKILLAEQQLHAASIPKAMPKDEQKDDNIDINKKYLVITFAVLMLSVFAAVEIHPAFIFAASIAIFTSLKAFNAGKKRKKDKPFEYVNHVEIAKYTENLQRVRNNADEEKTIAKNNIDSAKKRVAAFRNDISKMKYKIPELENTRTETENLISQLSKDKAEHEIKIAEAISSVNTKKEQINYISSEISSIEAEQNNVMRKLLAEFRKYKYVENINEFYIQLNNLKSTFEDIYRLQIKIESHKQTEPPNDKFSTAQTYSQIQNLEKMLCEKNNGKMPEKIDDADIEKLKSQTSVLLNGINSCKENFANINAIMKTKFKDSMGISHIEHEITLIKNEIQDNELYCNNIDTALKYIDEASAEIHQNFGSALNLKTAEIFRKLTGGKYDSVIVSSDFNIAVKNKDSTVEWQYLSSGTIDQAYFSLRLAVADMLSEKDNSMPILIDDAFLQYDDVRTKQGLDFLDDYSENAQIIFFTCHGHLIDMAVNQKLNVKVNRISNQ